MSGQQVRPALLGEPVADLQRATQPRRQLRNIDTEPSRRGLPQFLEEDVDAAPGGGVERVANAQELDERIGLLHGGRRRWQHGPLHPGAAPLPAKTLERAKPPSAVLQVGCHHRVGIDDSPLPLGLGETSRQRPALQPTAEP